MHFSKPDRDALNGMLKEITHCLSKIEQETQAKKDIVKAIDEKFGIKPKVVNKLAKTMYKQNYQELNNENYYFDLLYQSIVDDKQTSTQEDD